jgi:hypothetical protein
MDIGSAAGMVESVGAQAGQKQMAMADLKAAMANRPALPPFGGATPAARAAKADH